MRYVGIDQSITATGYVVIDSGGELLSSGVVKSSAAEKNDLSDLMQRC